MTKTSIKKEDEQEEEKPDMRSKYAMINIIKNKLRAAGQRDPVVMAVDACEETVDEGAAGLKNLVKGISKISKAAGAGSKKGGKMLGDGAGKAAGVAASGVAGGASGMAVGDKMFKPGVKKEKIDPKKGKAEKKTQPAIKKEPKYNPYGKDSKMNPTKASETTGP